MPPVKLIRVLTALRPGTCTVTSGAWSSEAAPAPGPARIFEVTIPATTTTPIAMTRGRRQGGGATGRAAAGNAGSEGDGKSYCASPGSGRGWASSFTVGASGDWRNGGSLPVRAVLSGHTRQGERGERRTAGSGCGDRAQKRRRRERGNARRRRISNHRGS